MIKSGFFPFSSSAFHKTKFCLNIWNPLLAFWKKKNPELLKIKSKESGFPGGAVVENLPANAGDTGSSPGLGRSHMLRSD